MYPKVIQFLSASLVLVAVKVGASSPYFNAITSLNPSGYWPMHEVAPAAPGDIETNYGTLGLLGTGYYPDWAASGPVTSMKRGIPGALANDTDQAVFFTRGGSPAAATYTNYLYIPHTSPLSTLNPPFSVECWFYPTSSVSEDIWCQNGYEGLNAGAAGGSGGNVCGIRLVWENGTNTGFQLYTFNNSSTLNSEGFSGNIGGAVAAPPFNWYHLVVTCDASTNFSLFVNGNQASLANLSTTNGPGSYSPDYWTPLTIGGGRGGTRAVGGYVDEFAVYTNVITDMSTHYQDGVSGGPGVYVSAVEADNPTIYLRMDAPAVYTAPAPASWPALTNYGTTNGVAVGNGVYSPGTLPGLLTSPAVNANGVPFGGLSGNFAALSGVSSFADAGFAPAYNPTGTQPFSVTAIFRGNPADGRNQTIIGHSDNSWNLILNTTGKIVAHFGTNATGAVTSSGTYNDGTWHQVVDVYTPNSSPGSPGTNALYVDGLLDSFTTNATANGLLPGTNSDVLIGSDPQFTNSPAGVGRSFAGQISDAAFFDQALTPAQIQNLYSNCEVAPFITAQPTTGRAVNGGTGTFIFFGVIANGSPTLAYQWYFNTTSNYSGATALVNNAHYINSTTLQVTVTNLAAADSGYYYAIITNDFGSVTSRLATLTVYAAPTVINQYPVPYTNNFTLFAGTSPAFSISASGAQPITYFWYTNGVLDSAATGPNFIWANVGLGTINNYCILTNIAGSATSAVWTATVAADPTAPYPVSVLALNPAGYWRLDEPDNNQGDGNPGAICFDSAGGNNGIYTNVDLSQAGYGSTDPSETSAAFGEFGSFPAINEYAGQIQGIDFSATNGANGEFTVEAWANAVSSPSFPQTEGAPLAAKGTYGVSDQFNLGVDSTKVRYRFYVRDAARTMHVVGSGNSGAFDNNWHLVAGVCDEANGQLSLYIDGQLANTTSIPTNAGIYASPGTMSIGASTANGVTYGNQFIGSIDDVSVYHYALNASQIAGQYITKGVGPIVTQPPAASVTVDGGGSFTIPVSAIGSPSLNYQWSDVSGGTNVSTGTTNGVLLSTTLTVTNVPAGWNNDQLELTINNTYGSTNFFVTLTIFTNAPQITVNLPQQVSIQTGHTYTYSISAVGELPLTYQWYNGISPILGQTNSTYTLNAQPGNYSVVISNPIGSVQSFVSTLVGVSPPTDSYATNILGLNPAGYWPLQETTPPAAATMETNYGSLGKLGNAYYAATNASNVKFDQTGAIAGDGDTSVAFGGGGTPNSYAFVPRISPALTIRAPFTLEAWINPSNTPYGVILGEGGGTGLNGSTNFGGWQMGLGASGGNNAFQMNYYTGVGSAQNDEIAGAPFFTPGQWYHYAVTYDGTNSILYVDGQDIFSATSGNAADTWSPLSIGSGKWGFGPIDGIRWFAGFEDEVAIYTNVLTAGQIDNHYLAGTTPGSNYAQTVLGDAPFLYYRMDCPGYTNPSPTLDPTAFNFGAAPVNGIYPSGTVPGEIAGPSIVGLGTNSVAAPINGVFSCVNAGYDPSFNPTGNQPFSATIWFKTYPADERPQTLMSHGGNTSWALEFVNTNGTLTWSSGAGPVSSKNTLNDGNWHQAVGIYDGTNNYLYIDGALNNSSAASGTNIGNTIDPVYLGGDPDFTQVENNERFLAGAIAQAAFFTNALTSTQVQQIYSAAVPISLTPVSIKFSLAGNLLTLSWPLNHTGWTLQDQTNSLSVGLGTNWVNVANSQNTNQVIIPASAINGSVFYRLVYP